MPTVFSHSIAGWALSKVYPGIPYKPSLAIWAAICASIPDADVLGFRFGIPYGSMWGHRGFTHSLFFALLFGLLIAFIYTKGKGSLIKYWLFFALATASHGLMDCFTTGGKGIALLAPFTDERFFPPREFRVVKVSPIGISNFISEWGWKVIQSEFFWIWIPCIILALLLGKKSSQL